MTAWSGRLSKWMDAQDFDEEILAKHCDVHRRTVFRWRAGTTPPSEGAQQKLAELGAPLPPKAAMGRAPASERIEKRLGRIEEQMGQALELLQRLQPQTFKEGGL